MTLTNNPILRVTPGTRTITYAPALRRLDGWTDQPATLPRPKPPKLPLTHIAHTPAQGILPRPARQPEALSSNYAPYTIVFQAEPETAQATLLTSEPLALPCTIAQMTTHFSVGTTTIYLSAALTTHPVNTPAEFQAGLPLFRAQGPLNTPLTQITILPRSSSPIQSTYPLHHNIGPGSPNRIAVYIINAGLAQILTTVTFLIMPR